jgi:hypothetical protein
VKAKREEETGREEKARVTDGERGKKTDRKSGDGKRQRSKANRRVKARSMAMAEGMRR